MRPLTIRAALLVGFSLILGLWLFAGYEVTLRIREAQRDALAASARYLQAQDLLAAVRSQVLVASVLVRDALLDPDGTSIVTHRDEIDRYLQEREEEAAAVRAKIEAGQPARPGFREELLRRRAAGGSDHASAAE